ncbi:MAG: hypothetical protein Q7S32_01855 [bacterium]|nr:hypothetical protein [bacterium]
MNKELPPSNKEEVSEQEMIEAIQSGDRAVIQKWTKQEERKLAKTSEAEIEFTCRLARLCLVAGDIDQAWELFNMAQYQALQEQNQLLYAAIMAEMDRVDLFS